jgi:hypothetical protein
MNLHHVPVIEGVSLNQLVTSVLAEAVGRKG